MPSLRTKSISIKVTDEEYALFEALAGEQTISEWTRDVPLKATKPNAGEDRSSRPGGVGGSLLMPLVKING
jgi:hypothetical protein